MTSANGTQPQITPQQRKSQKGDPSGITILPSYVSIPKSSEPRQIFVLRSSSDMFKFSNRNTWLMQMESFAGLVESYRDMIISSAKPHKIISSTKPARLKDPNKTEKNRTIKVAVLDDGFTLIDNLELFKENTVYGAIFDGEMDENTTTMSLQSSDGAVSRGARFPQAEFYSRRGHGDLMTKLIRKICPKAEFYIAKLEEVGGSAKGPKTRAAIQVYAYLHTLILQLHTRPLTTSDT